MAENVLSEILDSIGIVRINRPAALNALNAAALRELIEALEQLDANADVRCLLLTGGDRAFGSGTDVAELANVGPVDMMQRDDAGRWQRLRGLRKPVVAAVSGYAVGAGCELMLACDIVVAADATRIGLPDVGMGAIPGAGGTQRLMRAAGKARAMDLLLTGRSISAREAHAMGLVSRVVPRENYYEEAMGICRELSQRPPLALQKAKEALLAAHELSLSEGLHFERCLYTLLFATADQREGMRAFLEQRRAVFAGR